MIKFGTGGWRAVIGDDFTRANICILAKAMADKMKAEQVTDRGMVIGKDISLVGFDDSVVARYLYPGITCIRRATSEMGEIGAEMLLAILNDRKGDIKKKKQILDVELIERNSVAKIE